MAIFTVLFIHLVRNLNFGGKIISYLVVHEAIHIPVERLKHFSRRVVKSKKNSD